MYDFLRRGTKRGDVTCFLRWVSLPDRAGPEFTFAFKTSMRGRELPGPPASGYSTVQAMNALEQVAKQSTSEKAMG